MPELDRNPTLEPESREAVVLRRAMRDLLALCTIPAAWVGREPDAIAKGMVDVLVTALRVECGYLMLRGDPANIEVMQGVAPREVLENLRLKCAGDLPRAPLVHELCQTHRAAIVPIRVASRSGFVAAISSRVNFPTETESMLMSVAANQAAISLEAAHLRTEAELERRRLQELMAQAPAGMGVMNGPEHRWTYVNDYYVRVTGRASPADFIGKTLEESLPETETPVFRKLLDDVYQTGKPYVGREMKATLNRAGQTIEAYFDFVYQAIRNSAGEVEGVLVHAVEVTDKVLARRTIAESEERLRLAQSAAQIGTWEWDAADGKNRLSPELHHMFATNAEDSDRVRVWAERVHPDDWGRVQQLMQEGYRQGEMEFEYRYQNPESGTRWFYCKGRRSEGETRMLGVVQDVTERKTAEEAVRESEEELRILQRVGATLASELELKKLVQAVTDAGRELSQAEFGAFFYNDIDAAGEKYFLYTLSGVPHEAFSRFPMPRNTGVFGPTFRGEGTVRVADIQRDPRYGKNPPYNGMPAGHLPVRSYLAVPVISRSGEVIGGLFYGHSQVGIFTERAARLVEGIAKQAAIAIDNARLFETAQQERARAEESQARLRAIIETTPECVKLVAADGTLLDMNSVGLSLVGADCLNDVVGRSIYDVIAEEDRERFRDFNEKVCRGQQGTLEFDIIGLKGVRRHMQSHAAPLRHENGETIQLAVTRDITERKRAEEALRRSEEEFRALANAVPQLVWMANPDGWIFWYNEQWYQYTGSTPEQMAGWGWQSVHNPDTLPSVLSRWKHSIASGEPFEMTFPLRGSDGVFKPFLTRVVPVRDQQGTITRWFGTNTDVTSEVSAREELRANQGRLQTALVASQRLAAIVESSDDAIISKNLNGIVTSWNHCAESIFGYKAEEIIGKPITTIIPPELQDDERRILATMARGERIEHFETVRMKKSGELIDVSLTISPIKDEQGRVIGAAKIARDITQRKRTEKALQLTEKLASVGRLAATVAHELNNPLEAVTNFIFLAQTSENLPETTKEYLTLADRELERVSHIAQQTLGFYRDTSARSLVDIRESLDDVLRVFESKLRYKSLKADTKTEPGLKIEALGGEVRQVFSNLISNAIDASPSQGAIKIHAKTVLKCSEPYAQITFADRGTGIPDELKRNIFNPFFTTKSDVGTGLGLWVSKSLVEKHGGRIAFRSTYGKGTVFTLQFPLRASQHQKEHQRATA
ncbi:MAG: PAS domain S-box protein [Candidatus Angelobacter sp.]